MFGKFLKLAGVFLIASTLLAGAGHVFAAEAPGTGPETAFTVPSGPVSIPAGGELWFAFAYDGDGSQINIDMSGNFQSPTHKAPLTQFAIWTSEEVRQRSLGESVTPIGAGAVNSYNNNPDMIWTSNFNAWGTYYVVVDQSTLAPGTFQLTVTGSGVSVAGQPMPSSAAAPTTAPVASVPATAAPAPSAPVTSTAAPAPSLPMTSTASSVVSVPMTATAVPAASAPVSSTAAPAASAPVTGTLAPGAGPDNAISTAKGWVPTASGSVTWYSFQYAGDGSQVTIDMQVYPATAAGFAVWTPQNLQTMLAGQVVTPIGLGSASNSNKPNDLLWSGSFLKPGTYYVLVAQDGPPGGYNLQISGSGVNATH